LKLVVELDGFSHDLRPDYDAARDRWLSAEGYRVLRFTNEDALRNTEGVITSIREEIAHLKSGQAHP
jgi:very-short-patch-repair endonuclease